MSHDIIFQMQIIILLGYAQIAAALCGFIGVVFVFGERSQGHLSVRDSSAVFHFMFAGLSGLFLCLLTALLLVCVADHENFVWRLANGLGGLLHVAGASRLALESRRGETGVQRAWVMSGVGAVAGIVSLMSALGYLLNSGNLVFLLATMWSLVVTVISFISLLMTPRIAR